MRGKLTKVKQGITEQRITPADAGKTKYIPALLRIAEDHPRGCGENCRRPQLQKVPPGSPPRMRGKPNDETSISAHTGITPADAGKTRYRKSLTAY